MALLNKVDIDIINNVFNERNTLDSLYRLNEEIISVLKREHSIKDSIIIKQSAIIDNDSLIKQELINTNNQTIETYTKELKREKNKTVSFQALSGAGIIAIILLILL